MTKINGMNWSLIVDHEYTDYRANKIKKAIIKQNRPIASDKAKPKIA